jgi:hypothetical protein
LNEEEIEMKSTKPIFSTGANRVDVCLGVNDLIYKIL